MKIHVKNLGALKQAEFELGDLTLICGCNNTGKTYATYALYGFLSFWCENFYVKIQEKNITQLLAEGITTLSIRELVKNGPEILREGCAKFVSRLPRVFASPEKMFVETKFQVKLAPSDIQPLESFERKVGAAKADLFFISKNKNEEKIVISLLGEKNKARVLPANIIQRVIGVAVKEIVFGNLFPKPFIASAERTGAAIFRKELNFSRNRLLEQMSTKDKNIDAFELLTREYADYALPVKSDVQFTRQLEDVAKEESYITKEHPNLLKEFAQIIGGDYRVTRNDELYYIPQTKKNIKLAMNDSSSAVRSLLDIGFYLRHVAQKGDLLMVDEPELNLHPENQRRVARLFARLINVGIKVFITTHSDYIIKELNTLIMLNHEKSHLKKIAVDEGYKTEELISADKVRVYIAEEAKVKLEGGKRKTRCHTLVAANIESELGIEARSFDKTIDEMNRIQDAIVWGGK